MNSRTVLSSLLCQMMGHRTSSNRFIHSARCCLAVEKSVLSKLRKRTGFSISECKKALEQHDNDLEKAEEWMQKEALSRGWDKALNLSGRPATQGLIGVHIKNNIGAIVEVNCETDFVAKNEDFQSLVNQIAQEYSSFGLEQELSSSLKITNSKEELESIKTEEGKKLSDLVALAVGKIGENIRITRGSILRSTNDTNVCFYVHPSTAENQRMCGRFGALAVFKDPNRNEILQKELCAHIVGMNPLTIGSMDEKEEEEHSDTSSSESSDSSTSDSSSDDEADKKKMVKEEKRMIFQDFLSDDDVKVREVLKENLIEMHDFIRYEVGETEKTED